MGRRKKQVLPTKQEVMDNPDRPFYLDNYTAEEWQLRRYFERLYSEADQYEGYEIHGFGGDYSGYDV
ncbi:hypothetical protein KUA24_142 [Vibrio phage HNL01]|nr:hypothetical protein KUA24_142 [Vibrio phage HNL01]